MFEPSENPRIFGCAPGVDFPKALVQGLKKRFSGPPPEALSRVEVFVNTRRMQRRIFRLFDEGNAVLLPKIRLVTDLANSPLNSNLHPPVSPLQRRLELSQFISKLLDQQPDLAPRSALFDLSDSLALLLAEMQDEAVSPADIFALDVADRSGHWQRSQQFLKIVSTYFDAGDTAAQDQEARQRMVVEQLVRRWAETPPTHPIIIAGSTGSRGTTGLLMQAVAALPQGAVILPGFDFGLPGHVWKHLDDPLKAEDHPQFRLRNVMRNAGLAPGEVQQWLPAARIPNEDRNRLVSLALRPAPVTNQWLEEGPKLERVSQATANVALIEAPSDRQEALAISLALRRAADQGITAALVTPDRLLTRRVRAALDRWRIEPDVSAGEPLDQTAPGRLLRHVAALFGATLTAEALLIILKHPLVNTGAKDRGQHLQWTRELELKSRRFGPPFPSAQDILNWAEKDQETPDRQGWAIWITQTVFGLENIGTEHLRDHLDRQISVSNSLSSGPDTTSPGTLWKGPAGEEARRTMDTLAHDASHGGPLSPFEYSSMFHKILKRGEVRDPVRPHPNIMIWGTLEARVQGAELVILGGLNDGVWPEHVAADPWLNREMRHKVGLLVPERRIGLSAHDFQQAIAAKSVILCRSVRNAESQTVPSRWLSRLTNLMEGMSAEGKSALKAMRERGDEWLQIANALETPEPVPAAVRPAPSPPVSSRPNALSVTAITKLIRDPYAIYARYILGLKPLDPLRQEPDAPLRGIVIHKIFEQFIATYRTTDSPEQSRARLLQITDTILEKHAPWPVTRLLWRSKLERVASSFLVDETERQIRAQPAGLELSGSQVFTEINFSLTATADRIDQDADGNCLIYDYKTGPIPTEKQLKLFDKQLLLEAMMTEAGAFSSIGPAPVITVAHIGLGSNAKYRAIDLTPDDIANIHREFIALVSSYQSLDQGYASRRAMAEMRFSGDYDQLARFGEWDETKIPEKTDVGK